MTSIDRVANAEQREYWTQEGEHWVREADRYDAMNRRFGDALLGAANLHPGARVLDVGCGNGATTLAVARLVEPDGMVTGVDISAPMLALAQRRADGEGLANVAFVRADAQEHSFEPASLDVIVSRFGTMFFDDPVRAFANLHRALQPGGRLAITCWQDMLHSEWIIVPGAAAAEHVGLPDFGPPGAPGPFAFADEGRLRRTLGDAGFQQVTIEAVTEPMHIGDDVDDVIAFISSIELVRDHLFAGKPREKVAAALDAARAALAPYDGPAGVVMSGGAWLATGVA